MFTIEEHSGTDIRSRRRHNGYYAGDFARSPICTPSDLSALANLQPSGFLVQSGSAN